MKLVSYLDANAAERAGVAAGGRVAELASGARALGLDLPPTMAELLAGWPRSFELAAKVERALVEDRVPAVDPAAVRPLAPVPHPASLRDAYAFRQHVETARRNRGLEMIPEFDRFPVFYFSNHHAVVGEGEVQVEADHLRELDFELEAAVVIGRRGRNLHAREAESHLAGFMVMNDLSARALQREEMKLSLGPAKGKDFATALGPWLVTPDELEAHRRGGERGSRWALRMRAWHNGTLVSDGNLADMSWTFGEVLERVSYGVDLLPGDVIGSGTVGTGCWLELNGTGAREAAASARAFEPTWLRPGDRIELEIEGLGRLSNIVARAPGERRILQR